MASQCCHNALVLANHFQHFLVDVQSHYVKIDKAAHKAIPEDAHWVARSRAKGNVAANKNLLVCTERKLEHLVNDNRCDYLSATVSTSCSQDS